RAASRSDYCTSHKASVARNVPVPFLRGRGWSHVFGTDMANQSRQAALCIDRILKGEKSSDLPVQLPTKFELIINLKTAKSLGPIIPTGLFVRVDEVIE